MRRWELILDYATHHGYGRNLWYAYCDAQGKVIMMALLEDTCNVTLYTLDPVLTLAEFRELPHCSWVDQWRDSMTVPEGLGIFSHLMRDLLELEMDEFG